MDDGNRRGWPSRDKDPNLTGASSPGLSSVIQCRWREMDGWMDGRVGDRHGGVLRNKAQPVLERYQFTSWPPALFLLFSLFSLKPEVREEGIAGWLCVLSRTSLIWVCREVSTPTSRLKYLNNCKMDCNMLMLICCFLGFFFAIVTFMVPRGFRKHLPHSTIINRCLSTVDRTIQTCK